MAVPLNTNQRFEATIRAALLSPVPPIAPVLPAGFVYVCTDAKCRDVEGFHSLHYWSMHARDVHGRKWICFCQKVFLSLEHARDHSIAKGHDLGRNNLHLPGIRSIASNDFGKASVTAEGLIPPERRIEYAAVLKNAIGHEVDVKDTIREDELLEYTPEPAEIPLIIDLGVPATPFAVLSNGEKAALKIHELRTEMEKHLLKAETHTRIAKMLQREIDDVMAEEN